MNSAFSKKEEKTASNITISKMKWLQINSDLPKTKPKTLVRLNFKVFLKKIKKINILTLIGARHT